MKKSEPQGSPLYMLRNQNTHQDAVPPPIAVTAVINLVEGGRRPGGGSLFMTAGLLAPESGALRISAYRDFQSQSRSQSNPTHPLIAFGHLSLSMVIRNNASGPRQINVD